MLSGPRQIFCNGIVMGLTAADAYRVAYPKASPTNARKNAARLAANEAVKAEIARMRAEVEKQAGSAVLTAKEKREFFAELVRSQVALLPPDSKLWQSIKHTEAGVEYRLPDKLAAIKLDNDLAGSGSEAGANDALTDLLRRVMK